MKSNLIYHSLVILIVTHTIAFADKVSSQNIENNYTSVIILDKGIKRSILIPKDDSLKTKATSYSAKKINAQEGLIVCFLDKSIVSIKEFEEKYGLKLKTKFLKDYYIFENVSKSSDVQIINQIIENETNIKTVRPNWKLQNKPR